LITSFENDNDDAINCVQLSVCMNFSTV